MPGNHFVYVIHLHAVIVWHSARSKKRTRMNMERNEIPTLPDYETRSQAARRLNVSQRTINNLMRKRRLPFIKLKSKIVRFPKAEVDAYVARHFHINAHGQESG